MKFRNNVLVYTLVGMFIGVIVFFISTCKDTPPEPSGPEVFPLDLVSISELKLKITSPSDGSSVPRKIDVEGTVFGLPSEYVLRVFVLPKLEGFWYPQYPVISQTDSTWSASVNIGANGNQGEKFDICVIAVTEQQRKIIDQEIGTDNMFQINGVIPAKITVIRI